MSKRWWVSYSSDVTSNSIGVALTATGDSKQQALDHLKAIGVRPEEEHEVMIIDLPPFGAHLPLDVEWNKLPKDTLITRKQMIEMGYDSIRKSEMAARGIADKPEVSFICSDCT